MAGGELVSETAKCRQLVIAYCMGNGVDLGSGGDPVVPHAIQIDLHRSGHLGGLVHWVESAEWLPFQDETLDFVFSSHLLEDFMDWREILQEWIRPLKSGGYLIIQVPDRVRFRKAVEKGQPDNKAHKHESHLGELSEFVRELSPQLRVILEAFVPTDDYNILFIAQKP